MQFPSHIITEAAPKKRGRLREACNACSKAKKKCDGGHPCSLCTKSNHPCVYEERIKPGPPPKKAHTDHEPGAEEISSKVKPLFTTEELNFITIYLQNVHGSIPLMSTAVINDGILRITSNDGVVDKSKLMMNNVSGIEKDAIISLTWSACCYGAFLAQDKRAELYIAYSYKSLQKCFDGQSLLAARAFFALEFMLELFSESLTLSYLASRKGVYFNLGETILFLPSTPKDEEVEMIWNMIRYWKSLAPDGMSQTIHQYWQLFCSSQAINDNDNPIKHSHVMSHYWTCCITDEYYQDIVAPSKDQLTSLSSDMSTNHNMMIESHIQGIIHDIRMIKMLEDTCTTQDTNPPTTVILHFSLSMHRLKLHQFERAFHGLKSVAAYFWMHPFIISTPKMWKIAYITRMILLNSELIPIMMQSSLRPVADDLFALLCHTGKLFGFHDVYSSNSSPILSNIRKNIMTIMFSPSSSYITNMVHNITSSRNTSINDNLVTVLTMNGWLRLAQGEVILPISSSSLSSLVADVSIPNHAQTSQQQPVASAKPKLSSLAVPSNFIDKRICAPEKPVSSIVENQVIASTAAAKREGIINNHHPELSRDALIMLDHTASHRQHHQSNSSNSSNNDDHRTRRGRRGGNQGRRSGRMSSSTASQERAAVTALSSARTANTSSSWPASSSNTEIFSSLPMLTSSSLTSASRIGDDAVDRTGFNRTNSAISGVDELLLHMMNGDYGVDYSRENPALLQASASTAALAALSSYPPLSASAINMKNIATTSSSSSSRARTTSSTAFPRSSHAGMPLQHLASNTNSSSSQSAKSFLSLEGTDRYGIPRTTSEISMSVMDNIDTWMSDLEGNQASFP